MPDYSKAKIYHIYCNITGEIYYGSTCNTLAKRMGKHRDEAKENSKKNCSSRSIIVRDDYAYSLIEKYECNNKQELHARERYWIENNECVNKYVPGRNRKEHYQDNKDKLKEKNKIYHDAHKEENKAYREANKDKIIEQNKGYYETNKDKINEKKEKKVVCECGCELRRDCLTRHRKSKFHQEFMDSLSSANVM